MEIFGDFEPILLNFWSTLMLLQQNFKWNFNLLQQDNAQEGEPVVFDGERHGADGDEVFFGITRVPNFTIFLNQFWCKIRRCWHEFYKSGIHLIFFNKIELKDSGM